MSMTAGPRSGANPEEVRSFKASMQDIAARTRGLPESGGFHVMSVHNPHAAILEVDGLDTHYLVQSEEILGHLSVIAAMVERDTGVSYFANIARASALIVAVDVLAHGARPAIWLDSIQASSSAWYESRAARDYAAGCLQFCEEHDVALPQGESGGMRYLVAPLPDGHMTAAFSGTMTGLVLKSKLIKGERRPGLSILGVASNGIHANGPGTLIRAAAKLPNGFQTPVPGGGTLGEESLKPMRSYIRLVEALLVRPDIVIDEILPGTGDGLAKLLVDERPFTYRIPWWPRLQPIFSFLPNVLGMDLEACFREFSMGIGLYLFIDPSVVDAVMGVGARLGYPILPLGSVLEGNRIVDVSAFGQKRRPTA